VIGHPEKEKEKMKRLILTSMLTAAGLLAQSSGTAQTPAPAPDNSKPASKVVKKHHHKKATTAPAAPAPQADPAKK
jgi:hypothetical protein